MALEQRTLKEIQTDIYNDLSSRFGTPIPLLSKNVWVVLSVVLAGFWYLLYSYASDAFKQRFIQTANFDFLKLLGAAVGLTPNPATTYQAEFSINSTSFTGTLGTTTQFLRTETGILYQLTVNTDIAVGSNTIVLRALESGEQANLNQSQTVNIVGAIQGLGQIATVTSVTEFGDDGESVEAFRQRVLLRYRLTPQGGSTVDIVLWSREYPNAVDAFPYNNTLPGIVDNYLEVDNQTDGIPTQDQLDACYDGYINIDPATGLQERRPMTQEINMLPIYRRTEDVEVVALNPDNSEIRTAIETALTNQFLTYEPYIQGKSLTRNDYIKKAKISGIVESVTEVYEATFDDIILRNSGIPYTSAVLAKGQKSKFGTLT